MQAQRGLAQVLRTKRVEYLAEISDEMLRASAVDAEHLARLRSLGLGSYVVAPIVIQGQAVGAISFVSAESKRRYTAADAAFAGELGRRAAVAIENARLYRQVSDFAATLERRVEQRTAALLEANQELESFSYTVSHDLRAPVRHIGGFADLLRASLGDNPDEKVLRYLDTIKGAATQMGTLIDGLLNFSRLGRAELQKRPVELAALVQSVLTELGPDIADRRIRFSVGRLPTASVDATMLRLVLSNLIGNAAKYTRQRDPAHIQIGGRRELREIVIWVKDDGVGFDMAYVHKLFGVFQRLHSDVEFEGTGIGLATVRRVINRHGGRTWAEGTLGGGASFYFSLPIEETLP
jgi:light-regulated signal transduction histidine kinase (bacteriophytochrome)